MFDNIPNPRTMMSIRKFVNIMCRYNNMLDFDNPSFDDLKFLCQRSIGAILVSLWDGYDKMVISFEHYDYPQAHVFEWPLDRDTFDNIVSGCSVEDDVIKNLMDKVLECNNFGYRYGLK